MRAAAAALAFLLLAGCLGSPPPAAPLPSPAPPPRAPPPSVFHTTVRVPFDVPAGVDPIVADPPFVVAPFSVNGTAFALVAEARWSCAVPLCDLVLTLVDGHGQKRSEAVAGGNATSRVNQPPPGTWQARFAPANANVEARGEVRVSLFYNGGPMPNFTAWDAGS